MSQALEFVCSCYLKTASRYPFDLSSAASGVEAGSTSHLHSTTSPYPAAAVKTPNLQTHATPPPSQADIQPDTPPQRRAADHNHNCTPTPASPNDVFPLVLNPLTQQAAEEDLEAEAQAAAEKIREEVELIEELGLAISADAQDVAEFDTGADIDARILRSIPPKEDSQTPLDNDDDEDEDADFMDDEEYEEFVVDTRKKAAARAEGNRRIGGVRTQKAVEKAWNVSRVPLTKVDSPSSWIPGILRPIYQGRETQNKAHRHRALPSAVHRLHGDSM